MFLGASTFSDIFSKFLSPFKSRFEFSLQLFAYFLNLSVLSFKLSLQLVSLVFQLSFLFFFLFVGLLLSVGSSASLLKGLLAVALIALLFLQLGFKTSNCAITLLFLATKDL